MIPVVTENFTGKSLTIVAGAWVATRVFVVTGVTGEDEACDNCSVAHGDSHPKNSNMHCSQRVATPRGGPLSWTVTASYRFGDVGKGSANPLDEPPVVHPDLEHESLPFEYDIDGNPILNSAGDPYDPPDTRFVQIATFVIKRVLPFFDLKTSLAVTDHINSDSVDILSFGTADKGQAYCYYYRPCEGYTNLAPYVWVETKIGVRGDAEDPWQPRRVDKGRWGWYDNNGSSERGRICDAAGSPVDFDVLMDKGQPIQRDPGFSILGLDGGINDSIPNPDSVPGLKPDPKYANNSNITVLISKQKAEADFSTIINGK